MKIAITLVHNKGDEQNQAQIEALKTLLRIVEDGPFFNKETGETWTAFHQELIELDIPHEVKVYQVIPYGVTPPINRYEINSGGIVQFGEGDSDKVGSHPRFFNWGAKRGIDNGADISIYLEDVSKLNIKSLRGRLNAKPNFSEETFGKVISKEEFKKGQLREDKNLPQAVDELKNRVSERRVRNG